VAAVTPHSVTLAWDAAVNPGSFTYVIESNWGYRVGVPKTQTSYTWTRDMVPDRADGARHLTAWDFGCETWLFWDKSVDDVDPQSAILYEVRVNGVFDGAQLDTDRWIRYGTQASNPLSV
jgi:hypothetical protein